MGRGFRKTDTRHFFDEIYMMGNPLPWTDRLPGRFRDTYGYDILEELPSLVDGSDDRDKQVRRDYYSLITAMYEEAFLNRYRIGAGGTACSLQATQRSFCGSIPEDRGIILRPCATLWCPARTAMITGTGIPDGLHTASRNIPCPWPGSTERKEPCRKPWEVQDGTAAWRSLNKESTPWQPWEPACLSSMGSIMNADTRVPRATGPPAFLPESVLGLF